jgi:hypothetical protein
MITEKNKAAVLLPIILLCAGCFAPKGRIFTKIREPLALPAERTGSPVATKKFSVGLTRLKEPITRINLSVMWSKNVVREEAEKAGVSEICYSDLETLSVFFDSYLRKRIIFYGN